MRDINFFLLISLPLVIAAMGMMWDTSTMLHGISVSVDRQEESRTWQAVQSAVGAAEEGFISPEHQVSASKQSRESFVRD